MRTRRRKAAGTAGMRFGVRRCTWHMWAGWSDLKCCLAARYGRAGPARRFDDASAADAAVSLQGICCHGDWLTSVLPLRDCLHFIGRGAGACACIVHRPNVIHRIYREMLSPVHRTAYVRWVVWHLHRLITAERREITAVMRLSNLIWWTGWEDVSFFEWPTECHWTRWNWINFE